MHVSVCVDQASQEKSHRCVQSAPHGCTASGLARGGGHQQAVPQKELRGNTIPGCCREGSLVLMPPAICPSQPRIALDRLSVRAVSGGRMAVCVGYSEQWTDQRFARCMNQGQTGGWQSAPLEQKKLANSRSTAVHVRLSLSLSLSHVTHLSLRLRFIHKLHRSHPGMTPHPLGCLFYSAIASRRHPYGLVPVVAAKWVVGVDALQVGRQL